MATKAISNRDTVTRRPIYDSRGLITGYSNPLQAADYPGNGATGIGGRNYTGNSNSPSATTPAAPAIEPWKVTRTPKNPALSTAIDALLEKQKADSTSAAAMFANALKASPQNPAQLAKDQAAFDTSGLDTELRGINRNYETGQNAVSGDIANRNRDYELETQGNIERKRLENDAAIANIFAATNASAARAMGYNNALDVVSGNTNASGAGINQRARRLADLQLAAEGRVSDRRYNLIGEEQNLGRELYGNDQALFGRQSSLETDFAGRQTNTAQYLTDLKLRTAGKVSALGQQYLEDALRRVQMGLALSTDDIAKIGQIQQLDQQANWYEVNKPFDPNRLPVITSAPVNNPERNYTSQDQSQGNGATGAQGQGTPSTKTGTTNKDATGQGNPAQFIPPAARNRSDPVNIAYFQETGFWPDQQFDQLKWNTIYFRRNNRSYVPNRPLSQTFTPTPSSGGGYIGNGEDRTYLGTDATEPIY